MPHCFKAYDIRGQLGTELNEEIAYRIGRAYARFLLPAEVVVGSDIRHSSEPLKQALANGLRDEGVDVVDIGHCGTEEVYFATRHLGVDGGIMVTASHNPIDYNGMKLVRREARPISGDTGLNEIRDRVYSGELEAAPALSPRGGYRLQDTRADYVAFLQGFVEPSLLKPLKLVVNAGNGSAAPLVDELEKVLPFELVKVHHHPDGDFPNGIPNPILPENQPATAKAVIEHGADMGIAWDGDFDRCFLFDENGRFIEGYYIVGLLAEAFLQKQPGARIIHDPRLTWNTREICEESGGEAIQSKTGHAFIKERMRLEDAVYGGEMSAHHYFRDFGYCDSGMIPWLLVAELISTRGKPLSTMLDERMAKFPASGEINRRLDNPARSIERVRTRYATEAINVDTTDGISMEFENWRFNLRSSNTEPVVRLNVESRGDQGLMQQKTDDILALL
ncbi:phosphomannomutase CpsG [Aestuariirhabdus litorea]|uniref:phosphomannomutase n=1 Tax=Aestuariirhabdus litorea TaxID=2528527 RepID=A0A3P3VUQ4_9GAMM|nr:phosphomannomutase CpsG [Aestuariirhabdus litorea]RRJ84483.1 phosphomannomutase CpsG [Aestuariirhabdus litorea]RWW97707.1 phosphomannomutase CpsG [Endozoicomonadaceae bacterium GTF-13]